MRRVNHTIRFGIVIAGLGLLISTGCAVPRLGNRWFPEQTAAPVTQAQAPHYVPGQMPLPSERAVQPVAVQMPLGGQYDAQTVQAVRARRSSYFGAPGGSSCFS